MPPHTGLMRLTGTFQHQRFRIVEITGFPKIGIVHGGQDRHAQKA